jgi:hypothetical protein
MKDLFRKDISRSCPLWKFPSFRWLVVATPMVPRQWWLSRLNPIPNGQTIRTIAREADVRQERALPEGNRCNQRLTETRVSNITHYGIGHFQRRNLARDTFLAVTHVPHPFAA